MEPPLDAFLTSLVAVAIAEIGDKTQLLTLVLTTRFRKPWPILAGIVAATLANHALAGLVGAQVGAWLGPEWLRWIIGGGFLLMAGWVLIPDKLDEAEDKPRTGGAFMVTLLSFFVAEMGDKTQIATVGLAAAHPGGMVAVVAGSTLGLLAANAPVVWVGDRLAEKVDLSKARFVAAALFAAFGAWVLWRGVG